MSQFTIVARWITARRDEGVPFLVLGDFNRGLDKNDPFIRTIAAPTPLTRPTAVFSSPCWGHESFIDHILIVIDMADPTHPVAPVTKTLMMWFFSL